MSLAAKGPKNFEVYHDLVEYVIVDNKDPGTSRR